jgi:hypothetical protein
MRGLVVFVGVSGDNCGCCLVGPAKRWQVVLFIGVTRFSA